MLAGMPGKLLELLHWNDVHGRWDELARMSARAREIRSTAEHPVLVLDGGDIEESSVRLSALSKGVAGWRLLRAAGVDAAVVGNGGLLRYGPGVLAAYAEALGSPPLVCDVEGLPAGSVPSRLLKAGELKVGIIGATDFYWQYVDFGLTERARVTAIRAEAEVLRKQGADVVMLLSHCGYHADMSVSWALRGKVDLIVGGHSHDVAEGNEKIQGIPVFQADCYGRRLGRIVLDVSPDGVRIAEVHQEVVAEEWPADPAVLDELAACERDLAAWLDEPVGKLRDAASFDPVYDSGVTRLLIEALLDAYPADVGLLIAGHCETGLPAGVVTRGELWAATSSPGNAATATMTGAALRELVLKGVSAEYAETVPRVFRGRPFGALHLVGAELRDSELYIGDAPVDPDRVYRVTSSDLELSTYGLLLAAEPDDLVVHTPVILPELLEAYVHQL